MPSLYSVARAARKEALRDPNEVVLRSEGGHDEEPKDDAMRGVTDPAKILKSDTQRIDRNVIDPNAPDYPKRLAAQEKTV